VMGWQTGIFSSPVFSVSWSFRNRVFGVQETFNNFIVLKTVVLLNIFVKNMILFGYFDEENFKRTAF